jgi:hypothetical protein
VKVIELSITGDFDIPEADIKILGDSSNILWQKESLLNLAYRIYRPKKKFFIWCDHDLLFKNKHWLTQCLCHLDYDRDIVQLYSKLHQLGKSGDILNGTRDALAANKILNKSPTGFAGGVWAAKTAFLDTLEYPFYPYDCLGSNDRIFAEAVLNIRDTKNLYGYSEQLISHIQNFREAVRKLKPAVGYVDGVIVDLLHGSNKNRKYQQRRKITKIYQYDPIKDTKLDHNGILSWNCDKEELKKAVQQYFFDRKEDI